MSGSVAKRDESPAREASGEMRVGGYVAADAEAFIGPLSTSLELEAERLGPRGIVARRSAPSARWTRDT